MLNRLVNLSKNIEIVSDLTLNFMAQAKRYQVTQKYCTKSTTTCKKSKSVRNSNTALYCHYILNLRLKIQHHHFKTKGDQTVWWRASEVAGRLFKSAKTKMKAELLDGQLVALCKVKKVKTEQRSLEVLNLTSCSVVRCGPKICCECYTAVPFVFDNWQ